MWVAPISACTEISSRFPANVMLLSTLALPPPKDVRLWVQQSAQHSQRVLHSLVL